MRKIKLSVFDRTFLFPYLPAKGTITSQRAVFQLVKDLSFTDEEKKKFGFEEILDKDKKPTGGSKWECSEDKEIKFTDSMIDVVVDILKKFSELGEVSLRYIPLYDKFPEVDEIDEEQLSEDK